MKLKVGDIFTIPVSAEKTGFGQIVNMPSKHNFIMAVFEKMYDRHSLPPLEEIVQDSILLLGYSLDALLYHKYWTIVGYYNKNIPFIALPYFRLGTPPDCKLVNHAGSFMRKIDRKTFDQLEYQTVVAPVRYENAFKAYHQQGVDWDESFDLLMYQKTLDSVKLIRG